MATTKIITDLTDLNQANSESGLRMPSSNAAYSGPTVEEGMMRNEVGQVSNGSASCMQHYNNTEWKNFVNVSQGFTVDYLIVAGGGGGGPNHGGGGGAGGYKTTTNYSGSETPLAVSLGTSYDVTVGPGGAGATASNSGTLGSNSVFDSITSTGGGGGGPNNGAGTAGGSGGGGSRGGGGGAASPAGQGNAGAAGAGTGGGGGGGASTAGSNGSSSTVGGNGGNGIANTISGTSTTYAGGGGGNGYTSSGGSGGTGGGGNGGQYGGAGESVGTNGTLNTGGGGGGNYSDTSAFQLQGMRGGSGVVILRYPTSGVSSHSVTGTLDTVTDTAYPIANTAYYKLDGNANDSAGSINGTWSGTETYAAGRFGQAASFNGSSKIDITGFANFGSTGVSISAWVYIDSFSNGPTIVNLYSNNSIVLGTDSTGKFFRSGAGPSVTSTSVMSTANWHHVVMSAQTNGDVSLYLDGLAAGSGNATTQMYNDNNVSDLIGAYGTLSQPMNGKIDQVKIFNSPISASNVTSLYNEGTVIESTDGSDSILTFIGGTGTITFS